MNFEFFFGGIKVLVDWILSGALGYLMEIRLNFRAILSI